MEESRKSTEERRKMSESGRKATEEVIKIEDELKDAWQDVRRLEDENRRVTSINQSYANELDDLRSEVHFLFFFSFFFSLFFICSFSTLRIIINAGGEIIEREERVIVDTSPERRRAHEFPNFIPRCRKGITKYVKPGGPTYNRDAQSTRFRGGCGRPS